MKTTTSLHQRIQSWKEAVLSQDIEQIMSHYAGNVRAFDAVAALQFEGRDTYGEHWRSCLAGCALSAFEIAELRIEVEGNLGVCTFLNRCGGIDESGKEKVCWTRATQVYRNLEGRWLIIHEHFSVPFDMKTGEVLFGLTPESSR